MSSTSYTLITDSRVEEQLSFDEAKRLAARYRSQHPQIEKIVDEEPTGRFWYVENGKLVEG